MPWTGARVNHQVILAMLSFWEQWEVTEMSSVGEWVKHGRMKLINLHFERILSYSRPLLPAGLIEVN